MITSIETVFTMKGTMCELKALEKLLGSLPIERRNTEIAATHFTASEWKALSGMYTAIRAHNEQETA